MHACRAVLLAAGISVLAVAPAHAHSDLVSSKPADGADLTEAPTRIALTFSEDLLTAGDKLVVRDGQGAVVDVGPSSVAGRTLTANWPPSAQSGAYRIAYRAVAADGHPMEGRLTFTISAPTAPQESPVTPDAVETVNAPQESSNVRLWAPLALVAILVAAGLFVWRSRAQ